MKKYFIISGISSILAFILVFLSIRFRTPPTIKEVETDTITGVKMGLTTEPEPETETETVTTELETIDFYRVTLPVDYRIPVSEYDIDLMARCVMSEAGGQALEGKIAVAEVIVNRVLSDKYANNVHDVIYQLDQFSTKDNGEPNNECYQAVYNALCQQIYPSNMYYFRGGYYHKWAINYKKIGDHYFSLGEED